MLELLQPREGEHILDVGSESRWQTALLAHIVGQEGRVDGVEVISELTEMSKEAINSYGIITEGHVAIHEKSACESLPEYAPFNRIICAGELPEDIPTAWITQLAPGDRIVAPIGGNIVLLINHESSELERHKYPGYIFVLFVE
jgi:protein-L-isoaspartate(D-aspartate) O-methyltransferase